MSLKDQARSIAKQLSNLAKEKGVSYQNVATAFLIERLLARLTADKSLKKALVFKGGYVGLRVFDSPRYTVDLDALLLKADLSSTLEKTKAATQRDLADGVWFEFEKQVDLAAQGEYGGVRQIFRAGIGEKLKKFELAQVINFDLGIGDPVVPAPVQAETPELIGEGELSWQVYPVETMIAEKLHALISRGEANSRSKDIFDLALFLPKADGKILKQAPAACFQYRETALPGDIVAHLSKIDLGLLKRGWPSAISGIKNPPTCEDAYKEMLGHLGKLKY